MLRRLLLSLGTLVLALLVAEGLLSLGPGWSLRDAFRPRGPDVRPTRPRAEPAQAAPAPDERADEPATDEALGARLYRIDDDPRVSYSPLPDAELRIHASVVRTDALGLRAYTGPPLAPDSPRVVVLGDSLAFGFGVDDHQTLAARLQDALAAVRGPGAPPVTCRTVAAPSWNHRAAPAFLLDHWEVLRPDIVVYVPCKNDVYDLDGLDAQGLRRMAPDPASADPWLTASVTAMSDVLAKETFERTGGSILRHELGAYVIEADLSPESARRHDENADSIVRLRAALARRGARLLLCWFGEDDYNWHLSARLDLLAPDIPSLAFVDRLPEGGTLGYDPHPSPATLEVFGTWLAQDLLQRGWIAAGADIALPDVPGTYAERRRPWPDAAARAELGRRARAFQLKVLQSEIDVRTGRGVRQVYGGLNRDLSARTRVLLLLRRAGDRLELELAPLAERGDLYPLTVDVAVDGRDVGHVTVPPDGPGRASLALPPPEAPDRPIEVALTPREAVLVQGKARAQLASFRPLRVACTER